jgi:hypothetical protein
MGFHRIFTAGAGIPCSGTQNERFPAALWYPGNAYGDDILNPRKVLADGARSRSGVRSGLGGDRQKLRAAYPFAMRGLKAAGDDEGRTRYSEDVNDFA